MTTADKLRIKPDSRIRMIDVPTGGRASIGDLPPGATEVAEGEEADVVLLFVADARALRDRLPVAAAAAPDDRLLWVAYPKKGSKVGTDLDRDRLTALADEIAGLTGVALIAIDTTWSAMRLRPSGQYRRER